MKRNEDRGLTNERARSTSLSMCLSWAFGGQRAPAEGALEVTVERRPHTAE
jgi:hypothetical protein